MRAKGWVEFRTEGEEGVGRPITGLNQAVDIIATVIVHDIIRHCKARLYNSYRCIFLECLERMLPSAIIIIMMMMMMMAPGNIHSKHSNT